MIETLAKKAAAAAVERYESGKHGGGYHGALTSIWFEVCNAASGAAVEWADLLEATKREIEAQGGPATVAQGYAAPIRYILQSRG